jgi:hypothetical protein
MCVFVCVCVFRCQDITKRRVGLPRRKGNKCMHLTHAGSVHASKLDKFMKQDFDANTLDMLRLNVHMNISRKTPGNELPHSTGRHSYLC